MPTTTRTYLVAGRTLMLFGLSGAALLFWTGVLTAAPAKHGADKAPAPAPSPSEPKVAGRVEKLHGVSFTRAGHGSVGKERMLTIRDDLHPQDEVICVRGECTLWVYNQIIALTSDEANRKAKHPVSRVRDEYDVPRRAPKKPKRPGPPAGVQMGPAGVRLIPPENAPVDPKTMDLQWSPKPIGLISLWLLQGNVKVWSERSVRSELGHITPKPLARLRAALRGLAKSRRGLKDVAIVVIDHRGATLVPLKVKSR